jgi:hypothetical protein
MKGSTRAASTFAVLMIGAAAMGCMLALLPAAGHDQMWLLYAANLVRHGAKLYGSELFESNPPLIVWLSVVPSALAGWLHLAATAVGKFLVCGVGLAIAFVSLRLSRRLLPISRAAGWALGFVYVAAFLVMPARDFGQRDHLLALLCLPYLLSAARAMTGDPLGGWQAWLVGFTAGAGIVLKPHQVLVPLAVELTLLTARRRAATLLRPEWLGLTTAAVLYGGAIWAFSPDYLTRMLPVLRQTYWAFGHLTWWQLVREAVQLHVLAAVVVVAIVATGLRQVSPAVLVFTVAGFAATVAYYIQGTGWYYQQLPALTFFTFALALLAVDFFRSRTQPVPGWAPAASIGLCVIAVGLTAHFMDYPFTAERSFPVKTPDPGFFVALPLGTPVATLTTTVDYTVPPVFKYHLILAQRYPHLWILPAILRAESGGHVIPPQRLARLEQLQHDAMLQDFLRWQPRLVLVERCQDPAVHCQVLEDRHDDLLAWFLKDARFRDLFSRYRYLRSSGPFDAYVPK